LFGGELGLDPVVNAILDWWFWKRRVEEEVYIKGVSTKWRSYRVLILPD
jgi:hypothetical protein